ncbi:MAG: leader peptide processing enzyme [Treponema sp.]|nr:leader peptide processing enzyme [Treponema sp.]
MNKKLNTLFFVLGATVFNILVTVLSFLLLSSIFVWLLVPRLPDGAVQMGFALVFLMAIVASFVVYRFALNKLLGKIKFEDYFDPILKMRRPPPKKRND